MQNNFKHILFYAVLVCMALLLFLAVLKLGPSGVHTSTAAAASTVSWQSAVQNEFSRNLQSPISSLIIQIFVILVFSRVCAYLLKMLGQPQVIGEMLAGILLGKSVLAVFLPEAYESLFPESSMPRLYFLSQLGLIFFMFIVGLDLKISELKNKASAAVMISHVSIIFPFLLGTVAALGLYENYSVNGHSFTSFALFMGIAMSITAFPVLARIIQEKKMKDTPLGVMALTCAAVDDITAWCLLAAVIGFIKAGTAVIAAAVVLASILYILLMWKVVKPFIATTLRPVTVDGQFSRGQLALVFCIVLGSALIAEMIGIHALFGAFLAGTIMPQSTSFRSSLMEKIEDLCAVLLLPIFFAYTGIRMQVGLLNTANIWMICLGIIFLAVLGKMVGSALAARWSGMSWRDSWSIGALMNTRGLMELVVLNIGYDIGILSPTVFTIMVIMALVTTAMTAPLLSIIKKI